MGAAMSIELLLMIYFITYWAAVSFAYWAGWRARDRQRPPGGSYGAPTPQQLEALGYRPMHESSYAANPPEVTQ